MICVIKFDHEDGLRLVKSKVELWCGKNPKPFDWTFQDAQHAALADKPICESCAANIKKALDNK